MQSDSLKVFTKKMKIDLDKSLSELKEKGIKVENIEDSLERVAKANKTSSMHLYSVIRKFEQKRLIKKKNLIRLK